MGVPLGHFMKSASGILEFWHFWRWQRHSNTDYEINWGAVQNFLTFKSGFAGSSLKGNICTIKINDLLQSKKKIYLLWTSRKQVSNELQCIPICNNKNLVIIAKIYFFMEIMVWWYLFVCRVDGTVLLTSLPLIKLTPMRQVQNIRYSNKSMISLSLHIFLFLFFFFFFWLPACLDSSLLSLCCQSMFSILLSWVISHPKVSEHAGLQSFLCFRVWLCENEFQ